MNDDGEFLIHTHKLMGHNAFDILTNGKKHTCVRHGETIQSKH